MLNPFKGTKIGTEGIMTLWGRLKAVPGGKTLFSKAIGKMAPYTGTIGAQVVHLEKGLARLTMDDKPKVRNHLKSIHAIALANFVEETTGLAMMSAMPDNCRGIVTRIEVEYVKKARGLLTAECQAPDVDGDVSADYIVSTDVVDEAGDVVARGGAHWKIGPKPV